MFDCTTLGPRWKLLLMQEWTPPTHCGYGVGGLLENHHTDHRVADCVCRDCVFVREEKWAVVHRVVDGEENKTECGIVLFSYPLEIEVCERNLLRGSRVHSALKKLAVEPPATVTLSLCSQLLFVMSLSTLPSLRWSYAR